MDEVTSSVAAGRRWGFFRGAGAKREATAAGPTDGPAESPAETVAPQADHPERREPRAEPAEPGEPPVEPAQRGEPSVDPARPQVRERRRPVRIDLTVRDHARLSRWAKHLDLTRSAFARRAILSRIDQAEADPGSAP